VTLDTRHRAGKAVTLISGFSGLPADLEALGKEIKNHCGSGGSVKDGEIIVQGDHRGKVVEWLTAKGYTRTKKR
jgi:translation initiation factor 1